MQGTARKSRGSPRRSPVAERRSWRAKRSPERTALEGGAVNPGFGCYSPWGSSGCFATRGMRKMPRHRGESIRRSECAMNEKRSGSCTINPCRLETNASAFTLTSLCQKTISMRLSSFARSSWPKPALSPNVSTMASVSTEARFIAVRATRMRRSSRAPGQRKIAP